MTKLAWQMVGSGYPAWDMSPGQLFLAAQVEVEQRESDLLRPPMAAKAGAADEKGWKGWLKLFGLGDKD